MSACSCRDVRTDLSAYLEGDLDTVLAGAIRVHIESCAACRAELEQLRLTVGALRRLPDLPPPAAILTGVRARLRPEPWYRRLLDSRQWQLGAPVGALATLLVIIGISLFQTRYPDLSKPVPQAPAQRAPAPNFQETAAKSLPIPPPAPLAGDKRTLRRVAPAPATPTRSDLRTKGAPDSARLSQDAFRREDVAASGSSTGAGADKQDRQVPAAPPTLEKSFAFRDSAVLGAVDTESRTTAPPASKMKESRAIFDQDAKKDARQGNIGSIGEKVALQTRIEIVCLLPTVGIAVEDIEQFIRREGAVDIVVSVLDPPAVREAFALQRLKVGSPPAPSQGWTVTASVSLRAHAALIETLSMRPDLRILEQTARYPAPNDTTPLNIRITVLR